MENKFKNSLEKLKELETKYEQSKSTITKEEKTELQNQIKEARQALDNEIKEEIKAFNAKSMVEIFSERPSDAVLKENLDERIGEFFHYHYNNKHQDDFGHTKFGYKLQALKFISEFQQKQNIKITEFDDTSHEAFNKISTAVPLIGNELLKTVKDMEKSHKLYTVYFTKTKDEYLVGDNILKTLVETNADVEKGITEYCNKMNNIELLGFVKGEIEHTGEIKPVVEIKEEVKEDVEQTVETTTTTQPTKINENNDVEEEDYQGEENVRLEGEVDEDETGEGEILTDDVVDENEYERDKNNSSKESEEDVAKDTKKEPKDLEEEPKEETQEPKSEENSEEKSEEPKEEVKEETPTTKKTVFIVRDYYEKNIVYGEFKTYDEAKQFVEENNFELVDSSKDNVEKAEDDNNDIEPVDSGEN
jgi:hypothetical protein